jgi:ankyrin repeat protein
MPFGAVTYQQPTVFEKAKKGDIVAVRHYLDAKGDPNARETLTSLPSLGRNDPGGKRYPGETLLILAIDANTVRLVKLLLQRRADPNRRGQFGYTPLIEAARQANPNIVRLLLRAGAKVNEQNEFGGTAVSYAANSGNLQVVDMLIRRGANLNAGRGWTPLMDASYSGREDMAQLLLRRGADPNFHPVGHMSPLECAVAQSSDGIVAMLKRRGAKGDVAKLKAKRDAQGADLDKEIRARSVKTHAIPSPAMTSEDAEVIEVAMLAYLRERKSENIDSLRIDPETRPFSEFDDGTFNRDNEAHSKAVTLKIRRDLATRNKGVTSLAPLKPTSAKIYVRPSEASNGSRRYRFDEKPYAFVSLPGYSGAHDRAVVLFSFGPTSHGAAGVVFMKQSKGKWISEWCDLLFFA